MLQLQKERVPDIRQSLVRLFESVNSATNFHDFIKQLEAFGWDNVFYQIHQYYQHNVIFYSVINRLQTNRIFELILTFLTSISKEIQDLPFKDNELSPNLNYILNSDLNVVGQVINAITHRDNLSLVTWLKNKYATYYSDLIIKITSIGAFNIFEFMINNLAETNMLAKVIRVKELWDELLNKEPKYLIYLLKHDSKNEILNWLLAHDSQLLLKIMFKLQETNGKEIHDKIAKLIHGFDLTDLIPQTTLFNIVLQENTRYFIFLLKIDASDSFLDYIAEKSPLFLLDILVILKKLNETNLSNKITAKISKLNPLEVIPHNKLPELFEDKNLSGLMDLLSIEEFRFIEAITQNLRQYLPQLIRSIILKENFALFEKIISQFNNDDWIMLINDKSFIETITKPYSFRVFCQYLDKHQFLLNFIKENSPFLFLKFLNLMSPNYQLFQSSIRDLTPEILQKWVKSTPFRHELYQVKELEEVREKEHLHIKMIETKKKMDEKEYLEALKLPKTFIREKFYQNIRMLLELKTKGITILEILKEEDPLFNLELLHYAISTIDLPLFKNIISNIDNESLLKLLASARAYIFLQDILDPTKKLFLLSLIERDINILRFRTVGTTKNLAAYRSLLTIICDQCERKDIDVLKFIKDTYIPELQDAEIEILTKKIDFLEKVPQPLKKKSFLSSIFPFHPVKRKLEDKIEQSSIPFDLLSLDDIKILERDLSDKEKSVKSFPGILNNCGIDEQSLNIFLYRTLRKSLLSVGIVLMPALQITDVISKEKLQVLKTGGSINYLTNILNIDGEKYPINEDEEILAGNQYAVWPIGINNLRYRLLFLNLKTQNVYILDPLTRNVLHEETYLRYMNEILQETNILLDLSDCYQLNQTQYASEYITAVLILLAKNKLTLESRVSFQSLQNGKLTPEVIEQLHRYQIGVLGPDFALQYCSTNRSLSVNRTMQYPSLGVRTYRGSEDHKDEDDDYIAYHLR